MSDGMTQNSGGVEWGAPIAVNGLKPNWLKDGTPGMFENSPDKWLKDTSSLTAWSWDKISNDGKGCPIRIRLPADHPHYKTLEATQAVDWSKPIEAMQSAIEGVLSDWLREDGSVPDDALGYAALAALREVEGRAWRDLDAQIATHTRKRP